MLSFLWIYCFNFIVREYQVSFYLWHPKAAWKVEGVCNAIAVFVKKSNVSWLNKKISRRRIEDVFFRRRLEYNLFETLEDALIKIFRKCIDVLKTFRIRFVPKDVLLKMSSSVANKTCLRRHALKRHLENL